MDFIAIDMDQLSACSSEEGSRSDRLELAPMGLSEVTERPSTTRTLKNQLKRQVPSSFAPAHSQITESSRSKAPKPVFSGARPPKNEGDQGKKSAVSEQIPTYIGVRESTLLSVKWQPQLSSIGFDSQMSVQNLAQDRPSTNHLDSGLLGGRQ